MAKRRVKKGAGKRRIFKRKRGYYKSKVGKGEVMVNRTAARLHTVVAPHYLTHLDAAFTGAIWNAAPTATQAFSIYANGLSYPFNTGNPFTTANTTAGVLYPATLALNALHPVGFSQLTVLYSFYRVYASRISITVTPNPSGNELLNMVVYPSSNDLPVTDFQRAQAQPYSKTIMVSPNNNVKQNTISLYMDNPTILGLTKMQYNDSSATQALSTANPSSGTYWNVIIYNASGNNLPATQASSTAVNCHVDYTCEFFEPLPPTDI